MSKFNKSGLTLNMLFIIFIISSSILLSFEQSTILTSTSVSTTLENTTINSTIIESTSVTEENNENATHINGNIRTKKSGGLSAGGIVGIILPCVGALGGLGAAYALTRGTPGVNKNIPTVNYESSMSKFNTQPNNVQVSQVQTPVKEVEVIQPSPVVEQHPIYPIKKEEPPIINNNIIPQQIDTVQPITSTNVPVPKVMASQNQLLQNNNAIKIINNSQQIIPQNNVSQANPSTQVIPVMD